MKKIKLSGFFAVLFALLAFSPVVTKAQSCPKIKNKLGCSARVYIQVYSNPGLPEQPTCNYLCNEYSITIPAEGEVNVFCNCFRPCNVRITVTEFNGVPVTNTSADFSTMAPGVALPPGCAPIIAPDRLLYNPANNAFVLRNN